MKFILFIFISFSLHLQLLSQWYPVNSNTTEHLNNIFFVDNSTGYCVGGGILNGVILKTNDGGENWTELYLLDNLTLEHIVAFANEVHCYGGYNGMNVSVVSTDSGASWQMDTLSYSPWKVRVLNNDIYFIDLWDETLKRKSGDSSIVLTNNGTNIQVLLELYDIHGSNIFYVAPNPTFGNVYKSTDAGMSWNPLNSPAPVHGNAGGNAIKSIGDTTVIKTNYPSIVVYTFNNGTDWFTNYSPWARSVILDNFFIYGILSGGNQVLVTTDMGMTWPWQVQDSSIVGMRNIYFYNNNIGFVVGENGAIYKTTNGGFGTVGIKNNEIVPNTVDVYKPYPNPFNPNTTLKYALSENSHVKLTVYDLSGRVVTELINKNITAGTHHTIWDGKTSNGSQVASGVYIYKLTARSNKTKQVFTQSNKMVLLK